MHYKNDYTFVSAQIVSNSFTVFYALVGFVLLLSIHVQCWKLVTAWRRFQSYWCHNLFSKNAISCFFACSSSICVAYHVTSFSCLQLEPHSRWNAMKLLPGLGFRIPLSFTDFLALWNIVPLPYIWLHIFEDIIAAMSRFQLQKMPSQQVTTLQIQPCSTRLSLVRHDVQPFLNSNMQSELQKKVTLSGGTSFSFIIVLLKILFAFEPSHGLNTCQINELENGKSFGWLTYIWRSPNDAPIEGVWQWRVPQSYYRLVTTFPM